MCIIQDDEADKIRELASMQSIYSNATLTVCATKSSSCIEGFLDAGEVPGSSPLLPDNGAVLACKLPDGSSGTLRVMERAEYRQTQEPLYSRGWTLQESLLPTRLIRFGACLSWECRQSSDVRTISSMSSSNDKEVDFNSFFRWHESCDAGLRRMIRYAYHDLPLYSPDIATAQCLRAGLGPNQPPFDQGSTR